QSRTWQARNNNVFGRSHSMKHRTRLLTVAAIVLAAAACADVGTNAPGTTPDLSVAPLSNYTAEQFDATAQPMFTTVGSATPFRTSKTVPYWSSSFTDPTNGVTYPYTMVGSSPFEPAAQTTIGTAIIPFRLVFANGAVLDGSEDVASVIASPIFSDYTY